MRIAATQISCSLGDLKANHFRTLTTARAIENHSNVIVANRIGTDEDVSFRGASTIIDPYGATIAAACQDREQLIQAEISEDAVKSVRSQMEVFDHRRSDVYR
jgi:predicted amidohydrolase